MSASMAKRKMFPIKYDMHTWAVEAHLAENVSTTEVANRAFQNVSRIIGKNGLLKEVGVSIHMGERFYMYVKFDWPPESIFAIEALQGAFSDFSIISMELMNPFSVQGRPVNKVELKQADAAMRKIEQNQQMFTSMATSGQDFVLIRNNSDTM